MSSPDAIQQQRKHIHEFLSITERRVKAEATAKQQLEKEKAEAEDYLAGQKKHREQMEVEAQKRFDAERKSVDVAFAQVKEKASVLLKRAQSAFEDGKNALAELPQMIELKPTSGANVDVTSDDPMVGLKYSVERAEASVKSVEENVHAWIDQKRRAEARRGNIILALIGVTILAVVIILSVQNAIQQKQKERRLVATVQAMATGTAITQATTTTVAQETATSITRAKSTVSARKTATSIARSTATATVRETATATVEVGMSNKFKKMIRRLDMEFVYIPEGKFHMGRLSGSHQDERPQHIIYLDALWIGKTEVTNIQYQQCVKDKVCAPSGCTSPDLTQPDHPVVCINWNDAKQFCTWIDAQLPTEAQWEKSARGSTDYLYPWGYDPPDCSKVQYNACGGKTIPVGKKLAGASPYGVLDMSGNVKEWVADWYAVDYYDHSPDSNPLGPTSGDMRVLRGGSWGSTARNIQITSRDKAYPAEKSDAIGFRCAYVLP